ncbi:PREDICTED: probable disease resistance protein At1g59620 isoform X2 [Camelina sativa]|nr:PREDICTED: probable disease resistance protein At1g59620 isoform X2 [Camelina sativa]
MEEMGKMMIKHCGGLPLAVKVLGGLLAAHYMLSEWKRIYENIKSHIVGGYEDIDGSNISSVYHLLSMIFEELPLYLKQFFLYFAHFPEDYPIRVWDLAYFWTVEGIPRLRYYDGATIREVANGYIEELVERNMVMSKRDVGTWKFETCHLHDMMREVCLRKAKEENFVHIANSQSPCTSRRIAIHQLDTYHSKCKIQNPKLRSLLIMKEQFSDIKWMASGLCFTKLHLMRVLDLSYVKFELYKCFSGKRVVFSVGGFPQLQKLQIGGLDNWEEWIVEEGSMPLLHSLNIQVFPKLKELPDGLWFIDSLKELRIYTDHLEFKEKLSEKGENYYKVQHVPYVTYNEYNEVGSGQLPTSKILFFKILT